MPRPVPDPFGRPPTDVRTIEFAGVRIPHDLTLVPRPDPHLDIDEYDPEADLMAMNWGPQHPSTHGVLRVKLYLDGEIVIKAVPYLGYLHRGVEKLCEKLSYVQTTPILDKNDYVSPMINEQAYNMAVEKLLGVEVPARAKVLRTILAEIQRVASHLLWLGTWSLDMGGAIGGGATIFMYTFRERELILDLFEELTGARFHYNTHTVGGNRHDPPAGWVDKAKDVLQHIAGRMVEYDQFLMDNPIVRARTIGVGRVDPVLAMELGVSGPNLRASGVDFDLRRDAPYMAYGDVEVRVVTQSTGDNMARYRVRMDEMHESIRIAMQLLDQLPQGPISALRPVKMVNSVKISDGDSVYVGVESPRGELGTYLLAQTEKKLGGFPYRCKIRPPSLHSMSLLPYICPGATMSDVVVIAGSLDPILGEVDR